MKDECIVLLDFVETYSYTVQHAVHALLLLAIIKSKIRLCCQIIFIIMQMLFMFLFTSCSRVWKLCYHKCHMFITLVMDLRSNTKNFKNLTNLIHYQDDHRLSDIFSHSHKCLVTQSSFQNNHRILNVDLIYDLFQQYSRNNFNQN